MIALRAALRSWPTAAFFLLGNIAHPGGGCGERPLATQHGDPGVLKGAFVRGGVDLRQRLGLNGFDLLLHGRGGDSWYGVSGQRGTRGRIAISMDLGLTVGLGTASQKG